MAHCPILDLIWVNNLASYRTPSYHVQKLFANNPGDQVIPVQLAGAGSKQLFASATRDQQTGEVILKVVNGGDAQATVAIVLAGAVPPGRPARLTTLTGASKADENSFAQPAMVAPREERIALSGPEFAHTFPAWSLTVLRFNPTAKP